MLKQIAILTTLLAAAPVAHSQSAEQILGAIAGGALGSTIGNGDGRRAATVIGAVAGYRLGDRVLNGNQYVPPSGNYYVHAPVIRVPSDQRLRADCRRNVPSEYAYDRGLSDSWVQGCVNRAREEIYQQQLIEAQKRRDAERRAYEDGYDGAGR